MNDLIADLSAVVAKHASTLTAREWHQACEQVMRGFFPAEDCPQHVEMTNDMTDRAIRALREMLQTPDAATAGS
ncbi:hypothetical protein G7047_17190 [Diaphorobacter sp. HDW4A]|uniref:hypothetical protein n=1 Tax=Diaphorobacter sp. HDW4A TaxID=2714924 RepID=UPI00140759B9|nr:hypothetical protein [Diaphorobacter sp. HDW4A]QIL81451.1 hypothetical protein G7047_17190 [Diaphorobacter sp. HDW4A]